MKILHVYKTYYPHSLGGIEQMIYQLCEGLPKYGIDCEVLTLSKNKSYSAKINNHTVNYAKLNFEYASTGMSISAIYIFYKLARKFDIIHYHFPWPFADIMHFSKFIKKPTILTYHSDIVKQKHLLKLYTPLMHIFLKNVDKIVCTSPNYLASSEILQQYKNKTQIIPIGIPKLDIDLDSPENFSKVNYWQNILKKPFFLFVGVLRYYKGLHFLIEAVQNAPYYVVIAGSGPLEQELKNKVYELKLENIIFVGEVSDQDKNILFKLSYAFVFPSHIRTEAFGISLLEAAMHGKSMISCEIGAGMSFINKNNKTGYVIAPQNSEALRKAMDNLYNNPAINLEFAHNAKLRFEELFTADKMCLEYSKIYKSIFKVIKPL